jgi:hypothetical protein
MEWLQVGLLMGVFVVWAATVLAVLAILSMGRDRDGDEVATPVVHYRDSQRFDVSVKPIYGLAK